MVVKDVRDDRPERDYQSFNDRELVSMFTDGDRRAFEEFYKRYHHGLMRFIMSYCRDKNLAEDVVQDVFVKLIGFKVRAGLVRNIKSYIYASALNRCRDIVKKEQKNTALGDNGSNQSVTDDSAAEHIDIEIMNKNIQNLPERQKEVLLLRTESDLQFKEIASILGISENSAKVNYFYALTSLKKMMGGNFNE